MLLNKPCGPLLPSLRRVRWDCVALNSAVQVTGIAMTTRRSALAAVIVTCGAWARATAQRILRIAGAGALGVRWVRLDSNWSDPARGTRSIRCRALRESRSGPAGRADRYPGPGRLRPRLLCKTVAKGVQAIHEADPRAVVVSGGLPQPRGNGRDMDALNFARALRVSAASKRCFDALGDHPYISSRLPAMGTDAEGAVVTGARQAQMLDAAYRLVSGYDWSGPLFWYNDKDFRAPDRAQSTECFFGLLRHDGTFKPAALKYAAFGRDEVAR